MSRLIDADALERIFKRWNEVTDYSRAERNIIFSAINEVEYAPTVDAIPADWILRRMNETALTNPDLNNALFTVGVEWEKAKKRGDVDAVSEH